MLVACAGADADVTAVRSSVIPAAGSEAPEAPEAPAPTADSIALDELRRQLDALEKTVRAAQHEASAPKKKPSAAAPKKKPAPAAPKKKPARTR